MDPATIRSSVPLGDGDRVKLPTMLRSPEKAVTRNVGGIKAKAVSKTGNVVAVSTSRSHGCDWVAYELGFPL